MMIMKASSKEYRYETAGLYGSPVKVCGLGIDLH